MAHLLASVEVGAPFDEVVSYYDSAAGLLEVTPDWLEPQIETLGSSDNGHLAVGTRVCLTLRPFGVGPRGRLVSEVTSREIGDTTGHIEDVLLDGPFDGWRHRRTFVAIPDGTRLTDDIRYRGPAGGPAGDVAAPLCLRALLGYRHRRLRQRFGRYPPAIDD